MKIKTTIVETFKGYVDSIKVESKFLRLAGWAVDSEGEPVLNLKVVLDGVELPIWELKRVIREDVSKVVKNASSLCGFNFLISLTSIPKSANILKVIARKENVSDVYTLRMGQNATVNWGDVFNTNSSITAKKGISPPLLNLAKQQVNAINFVAVHGISNSGKTTLCENLFSLESGIITVHTDNIFAFKIIPQLKNRNEFLVLKTETVPEHFNITKYIDSVSFDYNLFIQYLNDELVQRLIEFPNTHLVLLDGYVFKDYEKIFADLHISKEQTFSVHALKVSEKKYTVDGLDVSEVGYTGILKNIKEVFRKKCQDITVPKVTYQNLESLGICDVTSNSTSDSETLLKYAASHLDKIVTTENRFADIGCNAGFFCFRVAEKTTGFVHGVDMSQHWLEIASHVNNSILYYKNITFFKAEAIEFLSDKVNSYEVVHCSSTYHYFRDQQIDFLKAVHAALSEGGMLVLEVELADVEEEKPTVIKKSRGVDTEPCAFPNRAMFLEQIKGLFKIAGEFNSVFQRGSFYNRSYFHLKAETL